MMLSRVMFNQRMKIWVWICRKEIVTADVYKSTKLEMRLNTGVLS